MLARRLALLERKPVSVSMHSLAPVATGLQFSTLGLAACGYRATASGYRRMLASPSSQEQPQELLPGYHKTQQSMRHPTA
jgi:hypothetical protein